MVIRYSDNIKKSYCQSVALGGTALVSIIVGDSHFSCELLLGVGLVIGSIFIYQLNGHRVGAASEDSRKEGVGKGGARSELK